MPVSLEGVRIEDRTDFASELSISPSVLLDKQSRVCLAVYLIGKFLENGCLIRGMPDYQGI